MKVIMLIPCLMLPNNRQANHKAMQYARENYDVDEFVVNDQEFEASDYVEGFKYLHGTYTQRGGFVKTRNELLSYFYNSDADYAIWMDANGRVTKSSLNDLDTLIQAAKAGNFVGDVVYSTLGINISGERIDAKKMPDYMDNVYLVNFKGGYDWLHGMMMVNLKKKYGEEHYIDDRCDPRKGTSEDIYLARLFKRLYDVRLCPTITVSKPSNKTSTWVADKSGYKYPPVDNKTVDAYINEYLKANDIKPHDKTHKTYKYPRTARNISYLKPYKPKPKKKAGGLI
nr:MAG TPA: synthase [Caudoviricetes sp.]